MGEVEADVREVRTGLDDDVTVLESRDEAEEEPFCRTMSCTPVGSLTTEATVDSIERVLVSGLVTTTSELTVCDALAVMREAGGVGNIVVAVVMLAVTKIFPASSYVLFPRFPGVVTTLPVTGVSAPVEAAVPGLCSVDATGFD